jgi:hypothetical protein
MTRYSYELNTKTNLVNRNPIKTFNDISVLKRGITNGVNPDVIKQQLLDAKIGKAESKYITIEEDWFKQQQLVESLTSEIKTIKDQLTGVEEVIDEETNEVITPAVEQVTDEAEVTALETRLKALEDQIEYFFDDMGVKQNTTIKGELTLAVEARTELEEANEWLVAYRGVETTSVRPEPSEYVTLNRNEEKELIAHERDLTVRNVEDSIADLAKTTSLAFSVISTLWEITSDEDKANIPEATRGMIDYAVNKFRQIDTRADDQLAKEGTALVDKLFDREVKITGIVRKYDK